MAQAHIPALDLSSVGLKLKPHLLAEVHVTAGAVPAGPPPQGRRPESLSASAHPTPRSARPNLIALVIHGKLKRKWNSDYEPLLHRQFSSTQVMQLFTEGKGQAGELARQAAAAGADIVVACGGDGTLNEVVNGLLQQGSSGLGGVPAAALAHIPLGTGCDFARTLGMLRVDGRDSFHAALARFGGPQALMDVCRLTCEGRDGAPVCRYFVNVASCGVSAEAASSAGSLRFLGSKLSYSLAAGLALSRHHPQAAELRVDGGEWVPLPAMTMVAAGSGEYFGGGMKIAPDADPFSGSMQVVALDGMGLRDFLKHQGKLRAGEHLDLPGVTSLRAKQLELRLLGSGDGAAGGAPPPRAPVECDGEVVGYTPLRIEVLPRALHLCGC